MRADKRVLLLWLVLLVPGANVRAQTLEDARLSAIPTPRSVLGFEPGEDHRLAGWSQIVDYFKRLDSASDRVSVHQPGISTERRPFIYAIISSEENIKDLSRIRENQRRLADPRLITTSEERERLIRETPAVVAITCSIHSTEIVASQMSMELAYRLASDTSKDTAETLRNTVLILMPSVNPDGIDIVTNWYRKTLGTRFEGTSPPVLYHHYTGHDDNRDWFMLTQIETQIVSTLFWKEWFPEIVYDVHQQGQYGSRMCVPPFFDPQNPNIDPVILREVGSIGMRMATKLASLGFNGIVSNSTYDTWWHGGLRTAPYYHNAVGLLTEAASAKIATPLDVKREQLRSPTRGLQNPLVAQTNFPDPWEGGRWSMRDIMNLELVTTRTALEEASLHRRELIGNFVGAAERAIEAGKTQGPYAYIVPVEQHDRATADRMIDILIQQGVEVQSAASDFEAGGTRYGKGSYVILMSQPYRANVKCLFERQHYPDRRLYPDGPAEPPYDVAGWTLPMQMGVYYVEASSRFKCDLNRVDSSQTRSRSAGFSKGMREPRSGTDLALQVYIPPASTNAFALLNEMISSGDLSVVRLRTEAVVNGTKFGAGTFMVELWTARGARKGGRGNRTMTTGLDQLQKINRLAEKYGVDIRPVFISSRDQEQKLDAERIRRPRVGVYRSWVPSMDEGWTRWVLEQFGFSYATITDADVRAGKLNDRFDVIILPDQRMNQMIEGNRTGTYPDEYCGGITEAGVGNLKDFVGAAGVLICLDSASELAIRKFGLPVKNVVEGMRRDQFYAPGSIFRARVDNQHPIGYGMPSEADFYFVSGTNRGQEPDARPMRESAPTPESGVRSESQAPVGSRSGSRSNRSNDSSTIVNACAFEITDGHRARSVARYIDGNPLRSGWLLGPNYISGKSALVDVTMGKGRVVLFGFRVQHRAQTWGTFKLLFNAIELGGVDR